MGFHLVGSSFIDVEGYYLGTDEDGRMIALSPFFKGGDRTNSNIVITGASGSGKSYLAKKVMLNEWLNRYKTDCHRSRTESTGNFVNQLVENGLTVQVEKEIKLEELILCK